MSSTNNNTENLKYRIFAYILVSVFLHIVFFAFLRLGGEIVNYYESQRNDPDHFEMSYPAWDVGFYERWIYILSFIVMCIMLTFLD